MRRLVIETATSACSVALIEGGKVVAADSAIVGRGHAERLLPMIADLPQGGRPDAIWVDCGPGSFTGIRVGIAAARALGFAWQVPVQGFSSMTLIAAEWFARSKNEGDAVTVVIEGGHGEVFVQPFTDQPLRATAALRSIVRADLEIEGPVVGNACASISHARCFDAGLDARDAPLLADALLAVTPIYGRAPDATPNIVLGA